MSPETLLYSIKRDSPDVDRFPTLDEMEFFVERIRTMVTNNTHVNFYRSWPLIRAVYLVKIRSHEPGSGTLEVFPVDELFDHLLCLLFVIKTSAFEYQIIS
jgi:hypothetical protein